MTMYRFILLWSLLFPLTIFGQTGQTNSESQENDKWLKHELGINMTTVLAKVLNLSDGSTGDAYNVTYRYHFDNAKAFRSAVLFRRSKTSNIDQIIGQIKDLTTLDVRLRLGYEKSLNLKNNFYMHYGVDGAFGIINEDSNVTDLLLGGTFSSETRGKLWSLGPMLRFEWRISNRMSLSSEASLYYTQINSTTTVESTGLNLTDTSKKNTFQFELPEFLFLNIFF